LISASRVQFCDWAEDGYPRRWRTRLECKLKDGSVIVSETENPRGDPENPPAEGELEEKFLLLASSCLNEENARTLLAAIKNLAATPMAGDLLKDVQHVYT